MISTYLQFSKHKRYTSICIMIESIQNWWSTNEASISKAVTDWLGSSGLKILLISIAIYAFHKFGRMVIRRTVRRTVSKDHFASKDEEEQREETITQIVSTTLKVVLLVLTFMLIVQEIGIDIGPLIAGASVLGVALGFGAQSLVKDFVSGIFIIAENQYRVGDIVEIAGVSGRVVSITMRETVLRNLDGHVHHVPNGLVDVSTNMTMEYSRINMDIGVSYSSDIKKVEKIINKVGLKLAEDEEWKDIIYEAPSFVRVSGFGVNEVQIKVLGKVKAGSQWKVAGELRRRIKVEFDKNGIEIPFPQMVVHDQKDKA